MKLKETRAVDVLYFLGGLLVATGAGLLSLAAGLITAGAFLLVASVLTDRSVDASGKGGDGGA